MEELFYKKDAIYFWLLVIHLLYDWHWQGDFVGIYKSKLQIVLCVHCYTWALLMLIPFIWFGYTKWYILMYLFTTHYLIDYWKCRMVKPELRLTEKYLFIDQALHVVSVIVLLWWL